MVYFLESNGEIINSNLVDSINVSQLESIFDIQISGTTEKYKDYLVSPDDAKELVRASFPFRVLLKQRVAVTQYQEFVEAFHAAWAARNPGNFSSL